MVGDRSRYGLCVSAAGAVVLAVSVFMPWYGVSYSAHALALAQHARGGLAAQLAAWPLAGYLHGASPRASAALPGQQLGALSAGHALSGLAIVLLALAALAMLDAVLPLARAHTPVPSGAGGSVVLLGALAALFVLYRMIDPPAPAGQLLALSLREGAWLALLGSATMALGGIWPRCIYAPAAADVLAHSTFSQLPRVTPQG
jgi:hypothetical protein